MKKMISACAIVLLCLSFSNCTKQPLVKSQVEQSTTGENTNGEEPPT